MVSHCTVGLLVLGSQRDEERGGEERSRGRGHRDGLAKQHLTWLRLQEVNFLKVMARVFIFVCVRSCVYVHVCAHLCRRVYALNMLKPFWQSQPAGSCEWGSCPWGWGWQNKNTSQHCSNIPLTTRSEHFLPQRHFLQPSTGKNIYHAVISSAHSVTRHHLKDNSSVISITFLRHALYDSFVW